MSPQPATCFTDPATPFRGSCATVSSLARGMAPRTVRRNASPLIMRLQSGQDPSPVQPELAQPKKPDAREDRRQRDMQAALREEVHVGALQQVPRHYPVGE